MAQDYKRIIKEDALSEDDFVRLTLKGKIHKQDVPYRRIIIRPVLIKGERHLQFSYFTEKQDITKNYQGAGAGSGNGGDGKE